MIRKMSLGAFALVLTLGAAAEPPQEVVSRKYAEYLAKPGKLTALDELMPQPVRVEPREGAVCAKERLAEPKTVEGPVPGAPELTADEAYVLDITPEGATITASSRRGFIWARQTLAQLAKLARGKSVPCCRIVDWPHLKWRGFMLDTVRNYLPVDSLKDVIDGMAAYKLNLFHWHLTENYAWRLESKRHPELQSERAFVLRHKGKYYTQGEFREIVDYAWARGVSLMPEFDFPGHCHAFRLAFGLKSMDDPRAEKIAADLFDELCELAPAEKMPFVHMGTDEVYKRELEGMSPAALSRLAKVLTDRGRTVVSWVPGETYPCEGPHVNMFWTRDVSFKKTPGPYFDAYGMYIESRDPFELTPHAAYWQAATRWERPGKNNLGAIFCAWHDGFVGEDYDNLIRNQQVFSSCVLFGDAFWHGRETHRSQFRIRMPLADDPLLAVAAELERRVIAQRDRCFADSRHPFHFLRQSDMRWRLTQEDGTPIARGVAQATISPDLGYVPASNGTVIAETWIRSPAEQDVGAWIGFTKISRDHGFVSSAPTPARGEWNRFGARAELNGRAIPPPKWKQPAVQLGKPIGEWTAAWTLYEADEVPFTDQEYFMREPTPIHLRKGWNHVRLVSPNPRASGKTKHRWGMTFIPLLGTTEHPREVPGLEYSDEPPQDAVEPLPPLPEGSFTYCVIPDTQRYLGVGAYVKKGRKPSVPTDGPTRNPAFESRVGWIARNLAKERIFFVSHTGDIVDFKNREQWSFASNLMTRLEGRVPFGISPGNHDVSGGDSTLFNKWFPRSRFEKYPWYAGAFERPPSKSGHYISGGNANSCQLVEKDGHKFVFLHLECNAPADVLDWAGKMLDRHADRMGIVCTHMCVGFKTQAFNREQSGKPEVKPEWFGVMDWSKCHGERGVSGEEAWRTCFSRHPNLVLVVSGDQSSAVTARETRRGVHGNTVHLTLQDYPRKSDDDDWLRLYRFRKDMSAIDVVTYSPRRGTVCQSAGRLHGRDLHVFTLPLDAKWR